MIKLDEKDLVTYHHITTLYPRLYERPNLTTTNISHCEVKNCEEIILQPRSEQILQVFPTRNILSTTVLIEKMPAVTNSLNVIVASSICSGTTSTFPCRLLNHTNNEIRIQKDHILGSVSVLTQEAEVNTTNKIKTETEANKHYEFNIDRENLTDSEYDQFNSFLQDNIDVFAFDKSQLGSSDIVEHTIELENPKPIRCAPYRTSPETKQEIEKHVKEMLKNGIIRESNSAWAAPVILVKKPDNSTRFCIDYRKLNNVTVKSAMPLPRTDEIFDHLSNAKYFSSLDLLQGFHQLNVAEESRKYTAFTTHLGLFEFLKLPFGLTGAPATFSLAMAAALRDVNWKLAMAYVDDVITYSPTFSEHIRRLDIVFQKFREANLKLNPTKCFFLQKKLNFLGHTVTSEGISPNEDKIKIVKEFVAPKNPKGIKQFLGLCGYYRKFVPNFAKTAIPLTKLLRKNQKFIWSQECHEAFEKLKQNLISPPVLAFPDFNQPFILYTDASTEAIGYLLGQLQDEQEKVISYNGRTLNKAERQYGITDLESLAIIEGVKTFRPYLHGRKFTIVTDHAALQWKFKTSELKGRNARWFLMLQEYHYDIKYKPGKSHTNADALSRLQSDTVSATTGEPDIALRQRRDPELLQLISFLENGQEYSSKVDPSIAKEKSSEFFLEDNILYKKIVPSKPYDTTKLLVIPNNMRKDILTQCHDDQLSAHFGFQKTYEKIRIRFFWPKMYSQIQDWCHTCDSCLKHKKPVGQKKTPLIPTKIGMPFQTICVDILRPMTQTDFSKKYILIFMDQFTRWPEAICLPSIEAPKIAEAFYHLIIHQEQF